MKRVGAQLIFCTPEIILRNHVIELNDEGLITNIFDLQTQQTETANTLFYNGIISTQIISLKQNLSESDFNKMVSNIQYINLTTKNIKPDHITNDMIVDFGTDNITEINKLLKDNFNLISILKINELINSCCYLPQQFIKPSAKIQISNQVQLLLWEGFNLATQQINSTIRISKI